MMSNWVFNASTDIPFSGTLGSSPQPYVYYGDQAVGTQHGQAVAVAPDGFPGRGLSSAPGPAPPQPMVAAPWNHQLSAADVRAWPNQQPLLGQHAMIQTTAPNYAAVQSAPKQDHSAENVHDQETELLGGRAQFEQQQHEGRMLLAQVESLTYELASERQRSDELGRQLMAVSAAHQALQLDHERLTSQHAVLVREHEHMSSSQAAALRELEARHADISRLQRQVEEAQSAAAAAASAEASAAAGGQQTGAMVAPSRTGGHRGSPPPPLRFGGHTGPHLAAADEERWALRLHKAERALEEERRVSEDLRQRLKTTEVESRAMHKKLHKLETELGSPSGDAMPFASSDPLPRSPKFLSPLSMPPPPLAATFSGALAGTGMASGPPSSTTGPAFGRAASAGSGVGSAVMSMSGQAYAGGGRSGLPGGAHASSVAGIGSGGGGSGTPHLPHPHEELVARLKREVDGLRSDLTRLVAAEEVHRVAVRAAEDRARAADLVSLDVRRQCDQAARTIGRLIDENSDLVAKVNAQANALADCKSTAANKEAMLQNLEARLAQAQAQLAAAQAYAQTQLAAAQAQAQARDLLPHPPGEPPRQQPPQHHQLPNGLMLADAPRGAGAASAASRATHGSPPHPPQPPGGPWRPGVGGPPPGREALLPGGGLTEADWKLVMLAEEVRRLVEEVSLSSTACLALQLESQVAQPSQSEQQQMASLDLPRILSRLEGLAGRRLGAGETAAYIIELAGHMEALEQVLHAQRRRMAALRGERAEATAGPGSAAGAFARDGASAGPPQAEPWQDSERLRQDELQQQRQQGVGTQAGQTRSDDTQHTESRLEERRPHGQLQAGGDGPFAEEAGFSGVPVRQAAFGSFVDGGTSRSGITGQQQHQPPLPPPLSPQSPFPTQPPPPPAAHHIVSPFNHLAHRQDPQHEQPQEQQQEQEQAGSASNGVTESSAGNAGLQGTSLAASSGPSRDLRNAQRADLAAAAAAAVAAAAAAEAERSAGAGADANAAGLAAAGGIAGTVPVVLPQYEAPSSPRAAPGPAAAAVGSAPPLVGLAVGVDITGVGALMDDDLLDEMAAGHVKPRRARVGLWGWISGEAVR